MYLHVCKTFLRPHWKNSLFLLTQPTAFWMADRKLFSRLHRKLFVYSMCEGLISLAISHMSAKHECERAHTNDALAARESKLVSVKLKNTRKYSQTNTQVLAIVLVSTRSRTHQYSQSFVWVVIFVGVSHNRINKLWCMCGRVIRGKLVHVPGDTLSWLYYNKYMFASVILYKWNIWKKRKIKNELPPIKFLAMLVETETFFAEV